MKYINHHGLEHVCFLSVLQVVAVEKSTLPWHKINQSCYPWVKQMRPMINLYRNCSSSLSTVSIESITMFYKTNKHRVCMYTRWWEGDEGGHCSDLFHTCGRGSTREGEASRGGPVRRGRGQWGGEGTEGGNTCSKTMCWWSKWE